MVIIIFNFVIFFILNINIIIWIDQKGMPVHIAHIRKFKKIIFWDN